MNGHVKMSHPERARHRAPAAGSVFLAALFIAAGAVDLQPERAVECRRGQPIKFP